MLILIRHAPIMDQGILCGRTDAPARLDPAALDRLRAALPPVDRIVTSPALRCRQTAAALWPERDMEQDATLWEQDFGAHDGLPYSALPDLGPLEGEALAAYRPPSGESFADVCERVAPPLRDLSREAAESGTAIALVVHAGVIRAALALTMGTVPAALRFEIDPLSVTILRAAADGPLAIRTVNRL